MKKQKPHPVSIRHGVGADGAGPPPAQKKLWQLAKAITLSQEKSQSHRPIERLL